MRRVSIINDCHELMPERLNIVKCAIDSEDLPLNVSCETLQQNMNWRLIMMNWVEKCLEMLATIAGKNDDHMKFWLQFGMGINLNSTFTRPPPLVR